MLWVFPKVLEGSCVPSWVAASFAWCVVLVGCSAYCLASVLMCVVDTVACDICRLTLFAAFCCLTGWK